MVKYEVELHTMRGGVTVAQRTLDPLILVRIQAPQLKDYLTGQSQIKPSKTTTPIASITIPAIK